MNFEIHWGEFSSEFQSEFSVNIWGPFFIDKTQHFQTPKYSPEIHFEIHCKIHFQIHFKIYLSEF